MSSCDVLVPCSPSLFLQRVYAMDVVDELMVVGTADRQIQVSLHMQAMGMAAASPSTCTACAVNVQ